MNNFPQVLGIIMDGNRRWADKRNLPITSGHKKGAQTLKSVIKICSSINLEKLVIFAFSTENWNRSKSEVSALIRLIEIFLKSEIAELNNNNIKFNVIGDVSKFPKTLRDLISYNEALTHNNTGLQLTVALNYGGKNDLVIAAKEVSKKVQNNTLSIDEINETVFFENLQSRTIEKVDLLIRTSGEQRISNFLPWQLAYAELYFVDVLWPDFTEKDLYDAMEKYHKTERRFGSEYFNGKGFQTS